MPAPDWNAIASYFAGKPIQVDFPTEKPGAQGGNWGTGMSGNVFGGKANLSPDVKKAFENWIAHKNSKKGAVLGTYALGTLIHEALHTRAPQEGFADWDEDERQARMYGFMLVPHLMDKFFGVKANSKVGREYQRVARKLTTDYVPDWQSTPLRLADLFAAEPGTTPRYRRS